MRLLLASTSRYRRELLARLVLPFDTAAPEVDESPQPQEPVAATTRRLAQAKAEAVASAHPDACVIGSDQLAELQGRPLGKPGDRDGAIAQLTAMSGRPVHFHTAVCVCWPGGIATELDTTIVRFRTLSAREVQRYADAEHPFDCAGSFKA